MYWNRHKNYIDVDEHWPNLGTMGWVLPVSSTTKTKHQNEEQDKPIRPTCICSTVKYVHSTVVYITN